MQVKALAWRQQAPMDRELEYFDQLAELLSRLPLSKSLPEPCHMHTPC